MSIIRTEQPATSLPGLPPAGGVLICGLILRVSDAMIAAVMGDMIRYFQGDVRRINHALKVFDFACLISRETGTTPEDHRIIGICGLLHDIGIVEAERKYHSSSGRYQETEGPPVARVLLSSYGLDEAILDRICFIIGNHHSFPAIDGIDFRILVEADLIVNIFEDSMGRETVQRLKEKVFRTESGIRLLEGMYLG